MLHASTLQRFLLPMTASPQPQARLEYWPTLKKLWMTWIPTSAVQFLFIPVPHQVLFVSMVSLGWNIALSLMYNAEAHTAQRASIATSEHSAVAAAQVGALDKSSGSGR
jgi:hypothetical protein